MIHGAGIDIVDTARFKKALERWGDRIKGRLFTEGELEYCLRQRHPERHLAARFAAKESVLKALGRPLPFKTIEIIRGPGGRPSVSIRGLKEDFRFFLTLSHDANLTVAAAVIERF